MKLTRTVIFRSEVFDLSAPTNGPGEPEPWGQDCAEAIRQAVSAASFAVDERADFDDDGWLLISKKDSEVYSLLIHAFKRRSDPKIFWWACHVSGNRTILEWLTGRTVRHHMDALCAAIENAARARGKSTELRWMTATEFNQFA